MSDSPQDDDRKDKLAAAGPKDAPEAEKARMEDLSVHEVHSQLMREKKEPVELYKPVPMMLLWGIFFLFAWAGFYMNQYSGNYDPMVFDPYKKAITDGGEAESVDYTAIEWQMERGARLYTANCAACHQGDAKGLAGVYPPLAASPWVTDDESLLVKILLRGLQGEIVVLGNTYNGAMPSYGENGSNWKDRDIAAVSTYVRQSFGNDAAQVLPETVTAIREAIADKSGVWTGDELLADHPIQ